MVAMVVKLVYIQLWYEYFFKKGDGGCVDILATTLLTIFMKRVVLSILYVNVAKTTLTVYK